MSKSQNMKKSQKAKPGKKTSKGKSISLRGKSGIKPTRKPTRKKIAPTTFNCSNCSNPFTDRKNGGWYGPDGFATWHCSDCLPRKHKPAEGKDEFAWYVMQCEQDMDRRFVKDVKRKLRIESLEHCVKRILIPTELREKIVYESGKVVASGECRDLHEAKIASHAEAKSQAGMSPSQECPDGANGIPGYKTACFQDHTTGKWKWVVRQLPENPQANRKVVPCKKFPGYILFHMKWEPTIDVVIKKASKFGWGFLLRPIILNAIVQVQRSKATGKWSWKLRHPETREILQKRRGYPERGAAQHDGELAKAKFEEFQPTAVKTKEAAELLIGQKAVNQIMKDKVELNRVVNAARVGDTVQIGKPHAFAGVEGIVTKITKEENPKADILCKLMGTDVPVVGVQLWQLEVVRRSGSRLPLPR